MIDTEWEAAQLVALLTTYIVGIEDALKPIILDSVAHLNGQLDDIYDVLSPIVGEAMAYADVNLPGD